MIPLSQSNYADEVHPLKLPLGGEFISEISILETGRRREKSLAAAAVGIAIILLAIFLTWIGSNDITTWVFDATIIGSFLLSDYVVRWLLEFRMVKALTRNRYLPRWFQLPFTFGVFFVIVVAAGDIEKFSEVIANWLYAGDLRLPTIGLFSMLLSILLFYDFRDYYYKKEEDNFWANIPAWVRQGWSRSQLTRKVDVAPAKRILRRFTPSRLIYHD